MAPKPLNKYTVGQIKKLRLPAAKALWKRSEATPEGQGLNLSSEAWDELRIRIGEMELDEKMHNEAGETRTLRRRRHRGGTRRRSSKRGTRRH